MIINLEKYLNIFLRFVSFFSFWGSRCIIFNVGEVGDIVDLGERLEDYLYLLVGFGLECSRVTLGFFGTNENIV